MKEVNYIKEDKGITNMTLIVLVLVVFIIILIGFSAYLIINPKTVYITQNTPGQQQVDSLKVENVEIEDKEIESKKEMTADERYKKFATNLKEEVAKYGDTANIKSVFCRADEGDGSWYEVCLNSNGNLSLRFGNEELDKKYGTESLVKNVIAFYIIDIGQDEWHCIYFINEDGTVGSVYVDPVIFNGTGEIEIKNKISGLKNIVSILDGGIGLEESGTHTPLFVDIDGKVYDNN